MQTPVFLYKRGGGFQGVYFSWTVTTFILIVRESGSLLVERQVLKPHCVVTRHIYFLKKWLMPVRSHIVPVRKTTTNGG